MSGLKQLGELTWSVALVSEQLELLPELLRYTEVKDGRGRRGRGGEGRGGEGGRGEGRGGEGRGGEERGRGWEGGRGTVRIMSVGHQVRW